MISPATFYGNGTCADVKSDKGEGNPQKSSQRFTDFMLRVDQAVKQDPDKLSQFHVFASQDLAFRKQVSSQHSLHVFTFEYDQNNPGKRKFIVCTIQEFFHRYMKMENKHHYELIKENSPCHLYFDIEFNPQHNPDCIDPEEMMRLLKRILTMFLAYKYQIKIAKLVELDSSVFESPKSLQEISPTLQPPFHPADCQMADVLVPNPELLISNSLSYILVCSKFSRHLVIHLENSCFQSQADVGQFVAELIHELQLYVSCAKPKGSTPFHQKYLYLIGLESVQSLFVYESEQCLFGVESEQSQNCFPETKMLDSPSLIRRSTEKKVFIDTSVYSRNRQFRLVLSSKINKKTPFQFVEAEVSYEAFRDSLVGHVRYSPALRLLAYKAGRSSAIVDVDGFDAGKSSKRDIRGRTAACVRHCSPFVQLDAHVLKILCLQGKKARFRSVIYFNDSKTVLYSIEGNRYCANIQRQHKSNGVYYVVDLTGRTMTQRCYDPDCKHFKSREMQIPNTISLFGNEFSDDFVFEDDFSEEDVLQAMKNDGSQLWG